MVATDLPAQIPNSVTGEPSTKTARWEEEVSELTIVAGTWFTSDGDYPVGMDPFEIPINDRSTMSIGCNIVASIKYTGNIDKITDIHSESIHLGLGDDGRWRGIFHNLETVTFDSLHEARVMWCLYVEAMQFGNEDDVEEIVADLDFVT